MTAVTEGLVQPIEASAAGAHVNPATPLQMTRHLSKQVRIELLSTENSRYAYLQHHITVPFNKKINQPRKQLIACGSGRHPGRLHASTRVPGLNHAAVQESTLHSQDLQSDHFKIERRATPCTQPTYSANPATHTDAYWNLLQTAW